MVRIASSMWSAAAFTPVICLCVLLNMSRTLIMISAMSSWWGRPFIQMIAVMKSSTVTGRSSPCTVAIVSKTSLMSCCVTPACAKYSSKDDPPSPAKRCSSSFIRLRSSDDDLTISRFAGSGS